jgi:hypothetical protein
MRQLMTLCVLSILAAAVVAGAAFAQEMTPEQQQAMMKAMTPGKHHKQLAQFAGTFEYTSKMWTAPGAPPMESKGTSEATMVMGGRYLQDHVKGNFAGMLFEGMALTGYDNLTEEFVFAWVDNMGTGIMRATGQPSKDGKSITFEGMQMVPEAGQEVPYKQIVTLVDERHHTMEWYMPSMDGEMYKMMELTYTRVK